MLMLVLVLVLVLVKFRSHAQCIDELENSCCFLKLIS